MRAVQKILVPVDFSAHSLQAVDYAAYLAEKLDATIDVMHAWHPHDLGTLLTESSIETPDDARRQTLAEFLHTRAGQELKGVLARLEARGLQAHGRLEAGTPRESIVEAATTGGYDLIVMSTRGRSGPAHSAMGSVAEWVVRHAPVPVVTVREAS